MKPVIDFSHQAEADRWLGLNDQVMGGVSRGDLRREGKLGVFEGHVSLANNGGFASVRREHEDLGLAGSQGLRLRIRGDGRAYQLRLHTAALPDNGAAYRACFETSGQWQTLDLPWHAFEPVFRGRPLPDAPPLAAAQIRELGLMTADKQAGPFRLEIAALYALA